MFIDEADEDQSEMDNSDIDNHIDNNNDGEEELLEDRFHFGVNYRREGNVRINE